MHTHEPDSRLASFSSDRPIRVGTEDRYSRLPFAKGLSRVIQGLPSSECFVIGLQGPWGDGKTSVLLMLEQTLQEQANSSSVVWFNPWRIGGVDNLLIEFFHSLAAAAKQKLKNAGEDVVGAISKYVPLLRPLGKIASVAANAMAPGVGMAIDGPAVADEAAAWAKQFSNPTVEELRRRLRDALAKLPHRIVVFIDDIDRLASDEIATVFRLVKACADFPNVVYVLAFDRGVVASSLGSRFVDGGEVDGVKYLDKIIQIPVSLPPASRRDLDRAVIQGLDDIAKSHPWMSLSAVSGDEQLRWRYAYWDCVARRLTTPRHVTRYLNAVRFAAPFLDGEANPVDLLLVEALRICFPAAYEVVRHNQQVFVGVPFGEMERKGDQSPQSDLLAPAKEGLPPFEVDAMDRLIEKLFPRYNFARQGMQFGSDTFREWESARRVCSPAYGHRYFSLAIGSSDIADGEIDELIQIAETGDLNRTMERLRRAAEPLRQQALVLKLRNITKPIPKKATEMIALGLGLISDEYEEPFSLQSAGQSGLDLAALSYSMTKRIDDEAARADVVVRINKDAAADWFVAKYMRDAYKDGNGSLPSSLVQGPAVTRASKAFLNRFDRLRKNGVRLLDLERRWLFEMLFSVAAAGGRVRVSNLFHPHMESNENVPIDLLRSVAQPISRSGELIPMSTPMDLTSEDLDALDKLVDLEAMARTVSEKWVDIEPGRIAETDAQILTEDKQWFIRFLQLYLARAAKSDPARERGRSGETGSAGTRA